MAQQCAYNQSEQNAGVLWTQIQPVQLCSRHNTSYTDSEAGQVSTMRNVRVFVLLYGDKSIIIYWFEFSDCVLHFITNYSECFVQRFGCVIYRMISM